jgi:hypothetical protein
MDELGSMTTAVMVWFTDRRSGKWEYDMNVGRRLSQWLPFFAWLSVVGLAVASWTPGGDMIRTGVRGSFAYRRLFHFHADVGVCVPRWSPWTIGGALAIYAGILEIGQIYVHWATQPIGRFCGELLGGCDHYRADPMDSSNVFAHAQRNVTCGVVWAALWKVRLQRLLHH